MAASPPSRYTVAPGVSTRRISVAVDCGRDAVPVKSSGPVAVNEAPASESGNASLRDSTTCVAAAWAEEEVPASAKRRRETCIAAATTSGSVTRSEVAASPSKATGPGGDGATSERVTDPDVVAAAIQ